jgi:hydrogenase maturation protease
MMAKPMIVAGLGNMLAGDDGVGGHVAALLAADPRLPSCVEAAAVGTDLLRLGPRLVGRRHVVLLDALLEPGAVGAVRVWRDSADFELAQPHAHRLSAPQALALLRLAVPGLDRVAATWITIGVADCTITHGLSPALQQRLPGIADDVLAVLMALEPLAT